MLSSASLRESSQSTGRPRRLRYTPPRPVRTPHRTCGSPSTREPRMASLLQGLLFLFNAAIEIYTWILIASVILSWLVAFNVVNTNNQVVYAIGSFIHRITEPVLRPIRNFLPSLGGLDLSPLILLLLLNFLKIVVNGWLAPYAYGMMY
ncbi:MAG: hypothetical protein CMO29_25210 [Tistrella sp.]|nr:hypothetical protein [Tistrella sp.]